MFGIHDFALFVAAGLLLTLTPGPDTALVVGQSIRGGPRNGILAALGVGTGCLVHIGAAAVGLSALLMTSATAFTVVKWFGVCYLLYVGLRLLSAGSGDGPAPEAGTSSIFWQGFLSNALNPKVAFFFLAFLPQFIDATSTNKALAFVSLGAVFDCTGLAWLLLVAWGASRLSTRVRRREDVARWIRRALGAMFIGLGAKLAMAQR